MTKPSTIIVWYRADLRVHDHPALAAAVRDADAVVPVFIFDDTLLNGKFASANRNRFLLECLSDLRQSLKQRSGDLVVRRGKVLSPQARAFVELIQPDLFAPRQYDDTGHSER